MPFKRCANCGKLNPRFSVLCQYCGVSLGAYRICSRGHRNRWDAQHCGICGDVFLSPAPPPDPKAILLGWAVWLVVLLVAGYILWENRAALLAVLVLTVGVLVIVSWLLRPVIRPLSRWVPWWLMYRAVRRR